jgi:hypothetical protein
MNVMKWIIVKAQGCKISLGWRGVKSDEISTERYAHSSYTRI